MVIELGFGHLRDAASLGIEETDDELDLLRLDRDGPSRKRRREVVDVSTLRDQSIEAVAIAECGLDGIVREVVRRKELAE